MKRLQQLLIAALFVIGLYSWAAGPQTGGWGFGGNPRSFSYWYAFFEAFPGDGKGTFGPCSTTAPTGARGQALTFSRASTATCTKTATGGLATTGIQNGDLVVMSANQPRVEYDSNGVLGLLVEASRTNSLLRSQELDNAAWTLAAVSAVVPVRTADAATQPDGTVTAERLDFPAVSAGGAYSVVYQGVTGTAAAWTATCYAKGVSGSGTIYMMLTPGGSYTSAECNYTSTSWTRCSVTATETAAAWFLQLGVDLRDGTQTSKSAQSVYVTDCQWEAGAYATSYIPTTSAAVTRAAESAVFDLGAGSPLRAENMSMAITSVLEGMNPSIQGVLNVNAGSSGATSGTDSMWAYFSSGGSLRCLATPASITGAAALATTSARTWCASTVAGTNGSHNGAAMSVGPAPAVAAQPARWVNVGASPFPYSNDGIYSRVCVDPSTTRCR